MAFVNKYLENISLFQAKAEYPSSEFRAILIVRVLPLETQHLDSTQGFSLGFIQVTLLLFRSSRETLESIFLSGIYSSYSSAV